MFGWLIGSSLKFRYLLVAASAALLVFGADRLRRMPVDVFPEFAPPKVEIQTQGPGMTAEEIEELVTIPMEDVLRATPGLDIIRSKSVRGLSDIVMLFKQGEDVIEARRRVQELLNNALQDLPQSSGMPIMLQPLSSTSRVLKIGITSEKYDMMDLSMIAYWTMKFRLMSVQGVANIPFWGERIKSLQIHVDAAKMRAHNVTLELRDQDVIYGDAHRARQEFGFMRQWSIYPAQIEPITRAMAPEMPEVELGQAIMLKAYEADWGPIQHEGDLHDRATYRYYWEALQRARLMNVPLSDEVEKLFFSDGS